MQLQRNCGRAASNRLASQCCELASQCSELASPVQLKEARFEGARDEQIWDELGGIDDGTRVGRGGDGCFSILNRGNFDQTPDSEPAADRSPVSSR